VTIIGAPVGGRIVQFNVPKLSRKFALLRDIPHDPVHRETWFGMP
jgi:hypothetical protein